MNGDGGESGCNQTRPLVRPPVDEGDEPMASLRKRGRVWYYRYIDSDGVRHECKGCPDRRETEAMAAALEAEATKVKAGLIDPKALGFRAHEA